MRCFIRYERRHEDGKVWLRGQHDFGIKDKNDERIVQECLRLEKTGHYIMKISME